MQRGCIFFFATLLGRVGRWQPRASAAWHPFFFLPSAQFSVCTGCKAAAGWALAPSCGRFACRCRKLLPAGRGFIGALAREPVAPTTPLRAPPWLCFIHMLFMRHTFAGPSRPAARFPSRSGPSGCTHDPLLLLCLAPCWHALLSIGCQSSLGVTLRRTLGAVAHPAEVDPGACQAPLSKCSPAEPQSGRCTLI